MLFTTLERDYVASATALTRRYRNPYNTHEPDAEATHTDTPDAEATHTDTPDAEATRNLNTRNSAVTNSAFTPRVDWAGLRSVLRNCRCEGGAGVRGWRCNGDGDVDGGGDGVGDGMVVMLS